MIIFLILGFIASLFQLVIVREFVFSIAKNEFLLIVAIGVWLLLCAAGSRCGKRITTARGHYIPCFFTLLFCISIVGIHSFKQLIGSHYYEATGLLASCGVSIFSVGPLGFFVGYCFAEFSRWQCARPESKSDIYGRFFAWEAIGFFIAGILFTFFLSAYANPFVFSFLPLLFVVALPLETKKRIVAAGIIMAIAGVATFCYPFILSKEFQGAAIATNRGSPYGPLVETEQFGARSLYVSGTLAATSEDAVWQEAFIHTAIASCEKLDRILIIGAASFGQIKALEQYAIDAIDCVEINPALIEWSKAKLSDHERENLRYVVDDPRSYLRTAHERYDCIVMNSMAPVSIALNRYFSRDFFAIVSKRLAKNGVFVFSIPSKRDILSPRYVRFNSCIINTVDHIFTRRFLVPSDSMIVLASNDALFDEGLLKFRFQSRAPATQYFTQYHLEDSLDAGRRSYINAMIDDETPLNTDDRPFGFLYYMLLETAKFHPHFLLQPAAARRFVGIVFSCFVGLWLFFMVRRRAVRFFFHTAVFGFASISLTSIIIVLLQIFSGALFWKIGIVIGICMLGIAVAALLVNRIVTADNFVPRMVSGLCLVWFLLFASLTVGLRIHRELFSFEFVLYAYALAGGLCTGAMYPVLSRLLVFSNCQPQQVASRIYSADLFGAFLGTFLCSVILLPIWGTEGSLVLLATVMLLCSFLPARS